MTLPETLSLFLGIAVSAGTVITVTVPALRNKLKQRLFQNEKQTKELGRVTELLEELVSKEALRQKEDALQREVDLCILRDLITAIYYRRLGEKKIHAYELEDVSALHDLYRKRGGNSYVHTLYEQMSGEWEVIR